MFKKSGLVASAAALLCAAPAVAAAATAPGPSPCVPGSTSACVLDLELNDASGSQVAADSSGMGHAGAVGSHVKFLSVLGSSVADFDRHPPDEGISYGNDHLIRVEDAADGSLDPGTSNFSVEIRFLSKEKFGNVIQKGQATTRGGQVKFQMPKGKISCMFKTPTGTATAGSGTQLINDGGYHTVRCDRTTSSVTMYIDGVKVSRVNHANGNLDNDFPWTLGGKPACTQDIGDGNVTCDYFHGDIDYVRISKG